MQQAWVRSQATASFSAEKLARIKLLYKGVEVRANLQLLQDIRSGCDLQQLTSSQVPLLPLSPQYCSFIQQDSRKSKRIQNDKILEIKTKLN